MSGFLCTKCGGNDFSRKEMRAEGGFLSAAFDISITELYRKDVAGASKIFDFLVS